MVRECKKVLDYLAVAEVIETLEDLVQFVQVDDTRHLLLLVDSLPVTYTPGLESVPYESVARRGCA